MLFNRSLYSLYFLSTKIYFYCLIDFRIYYFSVRIFQINCIIFIRRQNNKAKTIILKELKEMLTLLIQQFIKTRVSKSFFRIQARSVFSHTRKMLSDCSRTDLFLQTHSFCILSPLPLLTQWWSSAPAEATAPPPMDTYVILWLQLSLIFLSFLKKYSVSI